MFHLLCFVILLNFPSFSYSEKQLGYDPTKENCGVFGKFELFWCDIRYGFKTFWRRESLVFSPSQAQNQTYAELKENCDSVFVCKENTGCFQDFVNFQLLDQCIDDYFRLGPMYFCEKKLREVLKNSPDQISTCVKEHLEDMNPEKFDCESIKQWGTCFLSDVEKYCDTKFLKVFKEHQDTRLYNRACDGRLKYKDWDFKGTQDVAIQVVPGGIKIADPKRNFSEERNSIGLVIIMVVFLLRIL